MEPLALSRVVGLTALSNASFLSSPEGRVLYAAGCVCVEYDPQSNKQTRFFTVSRAISCMHLSADGKFLAIGERGHLPCVTVWDVKKQTKLRSYSGHEHGICSVQFSPDGKYLVSIGFKHDKKMMMHEWEVDRLICVEKMENKVNAISFHASGDFFVTCGDRHLKWWYLLRDNSDDTTLITGLEGRPASILKAQQDANFVDVKCCPKNACGGETSNIFCTTSTGMLCLVHEKRLMDKWVQLDSPASYCLTLTPSFVIVGGTTGDVFVFNSSTLEFVSTLPRPIPLSSADNISKNNEYADCYGLCTIPTTTCVAAMYADRSFFIWDIADILNPIRFKSFVFHKACIWDLAFIKQTSKGEYAKPFMDDVQTEQLSSENCLPSGTFATCGADNSVCLWNLDPKLQRKSKWKSTYSRDLLHCFRLDCSSSSAKEKNGMAHGAPDIELPDRQQGNFIARTLAVHPNGKELACGDKQGKLYIYDLDSMTSMTPNKNLGSLSVGEKEGSMSGFNAHEAEVLTLNYSPYILGTSSDPNNEEGGNLVENMVYLASAGRDRLVHIFDATETRDGEKKERYPHVSTLDSHSSSVTVVKFTLDGKTLLSCGGDKTMVLHSVYNDKVVRTKSIQTPNGTINGIALDIATNKYAVSTGQDKRVNVWNLSSGKLLRSYRPSGLGGEMYKCSMDPSGTFVATCSFDKIIRVFDFFSGEIVAQAFGHSDLITGIKFSPDGKFLLSIGGDGCIMAWNLSQAMVEEMEDRLLELYSQAEKRAAKVDMKVKLATSGAVGLSDLKSNDESQAQEKKKPLGISREKKTIRTGGGMNSLGVDNERPKTTATATPVKYVVANPPTRPDTAPDKQLGADKGKLFGGKRPSAPAWAMRKADSSDTNKSANTKSKEMNANAPKSRWAVRSESNQLQILGKPISRSRGPDRHKLTLELTRDDTSHTLKPPEVSSPSALAKTLEDSDDVRIEDCSGDISSSEEDDIVEAMVDGDGDSDEEIKLNQKNSQLDELEEHAAQLETWLERKLREEVGLDESISLSIDKASENAAQCKVIKNPSDRQAKYTSSDKAILGQSLSSTFFRNIKKGENQDAPHGQHPVHTSASYRGDDVLPPPDKPTASSVSASSDAMFKKRQETACAVAQMRERLRQMGILDRSAKVPTSELPNKEGDSSPTAEIVQNESITHILDEDIGDVLPPPPPSGFPESDDAEIENVDNVESDDDTASTVSGGSANEIKEKLDSNDTSAISIAVDLDSEEEESMRILLRNLDDAKQKAISAYSSLVSKKNAALSSSVSASSISSDLSSQQLNDSSVENASESKKLSPPTICGSSPMSQKRTKAWGGGSDSSSSLDILLNDFEHSFESLSQSTNDILIQSSSGNNLYRSRSLPKWQQNVASKSTSVLPPLNESQESLVMSGSGVIGDSIDAVSNGDFVTSNTSRVLQGNSLTYISMEDGSAGIEAILERYSDRLASMVSAKVLSSSLSHPKSNNNDNQS